MNLPKIELNILKGIVRSDFMNINPNTPEAIGHKVPLLSIFDDDKRPDTKAFIIGCNNLKERNYINVKIRQRNGLGPNKSEISLTREGWTLINEILQEEYDMALCD